MPKKRNNTFKQLQGLSSSSGKQGNSSDGAQKSLSVNERLGELRLLEGKDAAKKKAELAAVVSQSQRSVLPPELRRILGVPDSAPPKPKRGIRSRMPNRTPGPAPPESWTKRPAWTPALALRTGRRRFRKAGSANVERNRPEQLLRFARMTGLESSSADGKPSSLLHFALKSAAENWDLFDEDDLPALTELPLRLRLRLISYLGFYGPAISIAVLDALTADSSSLPYDGEEAVTHLDLAGLIGHGNLSMAWVIKLVKQQLSKVEAKSDDLMESWDQGSLEAVLAPTIPVSRLSSLSHLSLSHPPSNISWKDLLSLSKHIPNVTHLSLAYWPRPTLTPNLATATVSSQYSPEVSAGGSHFYSVLDEDLYEPASVLRILSGHLLRLTWLDLEGCTEWIPALAYFKDADTSTMIDQIHADWLSSSPGTNIFLHNWKNMAYLNCPQGWIPTLSSLHSLSRQSMSVTQRSIVENFENMVVDLSQLSLADEPDAVTLVAQRRAEAWLQLEEKVLIAERRINNARRAHSTKPVEFGRGWESRSC